MLLIIDNFDSFTYNLVQYFQVLGAEVKVFRNNTLSVDQCLALKPQGVVISPGPGVPQQAGISKELIKACETSIPVLGVCLGHQCLGELYGGNIKRAQKPMHGKISQIRHEGVGIFEGLPNLFSATRYHSLIVDRQTFPDCLMITAETTDGEIMGLQHRTLPFYGVQFHPESIASEGGYQLLQNFINITSV